MKNEVIMERPGDRQGKLTSIVFDFCHEESQKTPKLHVVKEYLGNETNRENQAFNILIKVKTVF